MEFRKVECWRLVDVEARGVLRGPASISIPALASCCDQVDEEVTVIYPRAVDVQEGSRQSRWYDFHVR